MAVVALAGPALPSVPVGFSFATTVPTNPKTSFPAELPGRSWESRGRIASTCYLWSELIIFELVEQDTPRRSLDLFAPEGQTGDGDNGESGGERGKEEGEDMFVPEGQRISPWIEWK